MRREVLTATAAIAAASLIAACGSGAANEDQATQPTGSFPAAVTAKFPVKQHLAQDSRLLIKVKNTGARTMPNVAVTLTNPKYGNSAQALGMLLQQPGPGQPTLAGASRAVWVIDQAPGPCGYSCKQGGPGAGATAYTNTWALGQLKPGQTRTFAWHVTAMQPGSYTVAYRVAAGLSGQATATGPTTRGQIKVRIIQQPRQASINANGQPVYN